MQPDIECDDDYEDADGFRIYESIRLKAYWGLGIYALLFAIFLRFFSSDEGKHRFAFLTAKMEDDWYWWEVFLLFRKVAIMCSGLFNTSAPERGWYLGSTVIILALTCHAFARPFKDPLVDTCEFVSLLSTLIIFQGGMVWNMDKSGKLGPWLEALSIGLIMLTSIIGIVVQYQAFDDRSGDPDQFQGAALRRVSPKKLRQLCRQLTEPKIDLAPIDDVTLEDTPPEEEQHDNPALTATTKDQHRLAMTDRVIALTEQLEALPGTACVNQRCTWWSFNAAEDFIEKLNEISQPGCEDEIVQLLNFERAHENRKGVILELQTRYMAALIVKHPAVRRLTANITNASNDAKAACQLLDGQDELDEAIVVLTAARLANVADPVSVTDKIWSLVKMTFNSAKHATKGGAELGVAGVKKGHHHVKKVATAATAKNVPTDMTPVEGDAAQDAAAPGDDSNATDADNDAGKKDGKKHKKHKKHGKKRRRRSQTSSSRGDDGDDDGDDNGDGDSASNGSRSSETE